MKKIILGLLALPILIVIVMFALPRPHFEIEAPRPAFWTYPKLSEAIYKTEILPNGKIHIFIQHPILKGIKPEMVAWFYQNLASGKAKMEDGKEYPYYQLFHLSEHGQTRVESPATDGTSGMGTGAIIYRQERFGEFLSKGKGRVENFSKNGFTVVPILGPLSFGKIEHKFEEKDGGTLYTVNTVLGSDQPIIGSFLTFYIRQKQFPPEVVQEWIRHQVEEVGSLVHLLPKIYPK